MNYELESTQSDGRILASLLTGARPFYAAFPLGQREAHGTGFDRSVPQ